MARAVRQENEAQGAQQMAKIRQAVADAKDEGFPADLEEREGFFMSQVAKGEGLCADSTLDRTLTPYNPLSRSPVLIL